MFRFRGVLTGLVVLLATFSTWADVSDPFLVEDIDPRRGSNTGVRIVELEGVTLLLGGGDAIRRTDGTAAGTVALDVPVDSASFYEISADRHRLYFTSVVGGRRELFVTDGTGPGTRRLTTGGGVDFFPRGFEAYASRSSGLLYFTRLIQEPSGGVHYELWATDGTQAGTRELITLADRPPYLGAEVGGVLVFGESVGERLYRTDGTAGGTVKIADVGVGFTRPVFADLGERAVFAGFQPDTGLEPWVTDGTAAGTRPLADLAPGTASPTWRRLAASGDLAYAILDEGAERLLLVSDGTVSGTRELARFNDPQADFEDAFYPFGERSVWFDARTGPEGTEPWVSDGTVARPLADLCPGPCSSFPRPLTSGPGGVYFAADDGTTGEELYFATGIDDWARVPQVCVGPCSSFPRRVGEDDGRLFYLARDASGDRELYRTDAGAAPVRLSDFPGREPFLYGGVFANGRLYLSGSPDHDGLVLHSFGETPGSVETVLRLEAETYAVDSFPTGFSRHEGDLFFVASDAEGPALFRKSGTLPAVRLGDVSTPGDRLGEHHETFSVGDRLVVVTNVDESSDSKILTSTGEVRRLPVIATNLQVRDAWGIGDRLLVLDSKGEQLLVTDGRSAPTRLSSANPEIVPHVWKGRLLYAVDGGELWASDGTAGGTGPFFTPDEPAFPGIVAIEPAVDSFYVVFRDIGKGPGEETVYVSDGSPQGTRRAIPANWTAERAVGIAGERLIFTGQDGNGAHGLRSTAGTPESVLSLPSLGQGPSTSESARGRLGSELWFVTENGPIVRTDGTPSGTRFAALLPNAGSFGVGFQEIPEHLLYRQGVRDELWVTDGTTGGTRRLGDYEFIGRRFYPLGDTVYFSLQSSRVDVGIELWAVIVEGGTAPPPPPPPTGEPAAPRDLRAEGLRGGGIRLSWTDASDNESRFVIQARQWRGVPAPGENGGWTTVVTVPPNTTTVDLDREIGFPAFEPTLVRVRAENDDAVSPWSNVATATAVTPSYRCNDAVPNPEILCLQEGRFEIEVYWQVTPPDGSSTSGRGTPSSFGFSDDSGTFWFFDPANVELAVKMLDARVINDSFWTFFGALSDVEYWIVVTDTVENTNVTYYNPPGELCGQADTSSFPRPNSLKTQPRGTRLRTSPSVSHSPTDPARGKWVRLSPALPPGALSSGQTACIPDGDTLCLSGERYRVGVTWRDQRTGDTGVGHAITGTADSGYFWFFDEENVELVVKVLDARTVNGFTWVFYGALTDVEYTLTVTDTVTGTAREYRNEPGNICGDADTSAF